MYFCGVEEGESKRSVAALLPSPLLAPTDPRTPRVFVRPACMLSVQHASSTSNRRIMLRMDNMLFHELYSCTALPIKMILFNFFRRPRSGLSAEKIKETDFER